MSEELKACPVCGQAPRRNGRGAVGGVLCADATHRLQTYGASQDDADTAWNTRPEAPATQAVEDMRERAAKVADDAANERSAHPEYNMACWDIAAAIRALPLGEKNDG